MSIHILKCCSRQPSQTTPKQQVKGGEEADKTPVNPPSDQQNEGLFQIPTGQDSHSEEESPVETPKNGNLKGTVHTDSREGPSLAEQKEPSLMDHKEPPPSVPSGIPKGTGGSGPFAM